MQTNLSNINTQIAVSLFLATPPIATPNLHVYIWAGYEYVCLHLGLSSSNIDMLILPIILFIVPEYEHRNIVMKNTAKGIPPGNNFFSLYSLFPLSSLLVTEQHIYR